MLKGNNHIKTVSAVKRWREDCTHGACTQVSDVAIT